MWWKYVLSEMRYQTTYMGEGDYNDDDEEAPDYQHLGNESDQLANNAGIHIYRGRNLSYVTRDKQGAVVGALWTELDNDSFTFDVVVHPDHRREGIATKLVYEAIKEYESNLDAFPDLKLYAQVVSPEMRSLLTDKFGWHVASGKYGQLIMEP